MLSPIGRPSPFATSPIDKPPSRAAVQADPVIKFPVQSLLLAPLAVFILSSSAFGFLWGALPLPVLISALALLISLPISMPRAYIKSGAVAAGALMPLGACLLAAIGGMITGVYTHEMYMGPYYAIALGRSYDNVLASTPGAAYADAGRIHFADTSAVQVDLSLGYRVSPTYCVAPIMDSGGSQLRTVAFWATGIDCCAARGSFMCGDGRGDARGAVRMQSDGIFMRAEKSFHRAVHQAAVVADLAVDQDPILLHWVESPRAEQTSKLLGAVRSILLGCVIFALISLALLGVHTLRGTAGFRRQTAI